MKLPEVIRRSFTILALLVFTASMALMYFYTSRTPLSAWVNTYHIPMWLLLLSALPGTVLALSLLNKVALLLGWMLKPTRRIPPVQGPVTDSTCGISHEQYYRLLQEPVIRAREMGGQ